MIKRISLFLITALFIAVIYLGYLFFKQEVKPMNNAIQAVPANAVIIIEGSDIKALWRKISETNIIWEELKTTDTFEELDSRAHFLDSVIMHESSLKKALYDSPMIFSAHMSGAEAYSFMLTSSVPPSVTVSKIKDIISANDEAIQFVERSYNEMKIVEVKSPNISFSFCVDNGILNASFSPILIEDAIRHRTQATPLIEKESFKKLYETSGKHVDANVFINYPELTKVLTPTLNRVSRDKVKRLKNYAGWSSLDLAVKPNQVRLNGLIHSSDSVDNYLNIFKNQNPQKPRMAEVFPINTAYFMHFGISNFSEFIKDYKAYLEKHNQLYEWNKSVETLSEQADFDVIENAQKWVGNEFAYIMTEPISKDYKNNRFIIVKATNRDLALESLSNFDDEEPEVYLDDYRLHHHTLDFFPAKVIGQRFIRVKTNHYCTIGDYLVFAETKSALRDFVSAHYQDKTLSKDRNFDDFSDNLASKSNILFYNNISRSPYLYRNIFHDEYQHDFEEKIELYRKFEAVCYQVSYSGKDLFYNNIFLKYNPIYKQETASLWEVPLDTSVSTRPHLVVNHYTQAKEIFVQDDANTVYLISNTGKILWKRKLDEPIMGNVHQMDIYKNKKLQMVFNTASKVYVLDRNGKDVEKFPVKTKTAITSPIAVMDYDNNRDYRILVTVESGEILNYDAKGKIVKGWEFKTKNGKIIRTPQHIRLGNKDYILTISNTHNVYLLNRRGEVRVPLKEKMTPISESDLYLDLGNDIKQSKMVYSDTTGVPIKYYFNGNVDPISLDEKASNHQFVYADLNNNDLGQFVFLFDSKLIVFDSDKTLMLENDLGATGRVHLQVVQAGKSGKKIVVVDVENNRVHVFNHMGLLEEGMPLFGSTQVAVGDINKDGVINLVTGSSDGKIYTYQLK